MSGTQQPEALRLAYKYEIEGFSQDHPFAQEQWCWQAVVELRRQHARIEELEARRALLAGASAPVAQADAKGAALAQGGWCDGCSPDNCCGCGPGAAQAREQP